MFNKVILVGRLTREPELKYLQGDKSVANFGLACGETWKDKDGNKQERTMFIDVAVFGKGVEIANQYLKKGNRVLVEGKLTFEQWGKDGAKRSKHKITADSVKFMETKAESEKSAKSDTQPPQNQPEASIDIDDDGIPF